MRHSRAREVAAAAVLIAAFAACVTDGVGTIECENGLLCPVRTMCAPTDPAEPMTDYRCDPDGCGDRQVDWENGERCDDGNVVDGDGCSASCRVIESCGDGKLDPGEGCDSTVPDSDVACSDDCRPLRDCGNGEVNPDEDCDEGIDGVPRATPKCNDDCREPWCGDENRNPRFVNPATGRREQCDEGEENTATCDADCTLPVCGDGLRNVAAGETCDDGEGNDDTAACLSSCKKATCGDGFVWAGVEGCEDGDGDNTDECPDGPSGTCQPAHCGDGHERVGVEGCDDGDGDNTDRCPDGPDGSCQAAICGDGFVWRDRPAEEGGPETCDDGGDSTTCNGPLAGDLECRAAVCGDGYANRAADESCDTGIGDSAICDYDCTAVACGDGHPNLAAGEFCDRGTGGVPRDSERCDQDCTSVTCGDGHRNLVAGEFCDDGNELAFDDCPSGSGAPLEAQCKPARCGDGAVRIGIEQCDPEFRPNDPAADTLNCDNDCTLPACGDQHINAARNENCDDGNGINVDACPDGPAGTCRAARCGDGFVREDAPGEICDTGGNSATCDSDCTLPECNDSVFNPETEECDPTATESSCPVGEQCAACQCV